MTRPEPDFYSNSGTKGFTGEQERMHIIRVSTGTKDTLIYEPANVKTKSLSSISGLYFDRFSGINYYN